MPGRNWIPELDTDDISIGADGSNKATLSATGLTADRAQALPDADGTVLLDSTLDTTIIKKPGGTAQALLYVISGGQLGDGPTTLLTMPPSTGAIVVDFNGVGLTNVAGATIQITRNATAISDAIDVATANAVTRAATLDQNQAGLAPGDDLRIAGTNNPNARYNIYLWFFPV